MAIDMEKLRQAPLFATLEPEDLAHVCAVTRRQSYERGEMILFEQERGGALYLTLSGLIRIFKISPEGKEQTLRLISAGQTFNDVPALDGGPNPASAMAMEPSVVYAISGAELRRLIRERPAVAAAVTQTLAAALRHMVALVEDLSFRRVTERVAKILLEQERDTAKAPGRRRLTQQEIAAMAGTAREMVGRALKELESAGAIRMDHGRIVVLDSTRLEMLS